MVKRRRTGLLLASSLTVLLLTFGGVVAVFADTSYVVRTGDTLFSIAGRLGSTIPAIVQANGIANPDLIYIGQTLIIPDGSPPPATPPPTQPPPSPPPAGANYVVQSGDNLFRISLRFGVPMMQLAQANGIADIDLIYAGQPLVVPGQTAVIVPPPQPQPQPPAPIAPTSTAAPPPANPPLTAGFALGGQTDSLAHPDLMRAAGMTWVKIVHKWTPTDDPTAVAGPIAGAHGQNFNVLLSVTGINAYPAPGSLDYAAFVNFLRGVASLGPQAPEAIEVWQEMNIDFEWPAGEIDPGGYVENMLRPSYEAVKAVDPSILVISGGLAPTGVDNGHNVWSDARYLSGLVNAGADRYADCLGIHFTAGATPPAAVSGHPGGDHYSWYFASTFNLYAAAFGRGEPLCLTQLGYLSGEGFPALSPKYDWAGGTTAAEQATWLAEAVQLARANERVRLVIIYNVDATFYDPVGEPQAGYAMLRPDGRCPACSVIGDR